MNSDCDAVKLNVSLFETKMKYFGKINEVDTSTKFEPHLRFEFYSWTKVLEQDQTLN